MNIKLLSLAVILLMVIGSFGAVGNQIKNETEEDCGCNDINEETSDDIEYKEYYLGLLPGEPLPPGEEFTGRAPTSFDWRDEGGKDWTTPIKDQGACGSCYAFGSYAAMEACIKIKSNKPDLNIDLSEQFMVSCGKDWVQGLSGCSGSYGVGPIVEFIEKYGAIPESCFPYTSGGGSVPPCSNKCNDWEELRKDIDGWGSVSSSQESIKNALIQYGPLPTGMEVYSNFNDYDGGVYEPSGSLQGLHLVAIVGYNDNPGYWICKNSWGTDWGENGWFKIKYGVCKIEQDTVYLEAQPAGDTLKTYYGQEWDEDADGDLWPPSGDVKNYPPHCLRMGESWWPEDGDARYMFDVGADIVKDNMLVGIYFCDWAAAPFTGGPDLRIYNWETKSWKNWGNVGDHDEKKWVWRSTGSSSNDYVNDDGWVWVRIHTVGDDDTVLDTIGLQFDPIKPNLACSGELDFKTTQPGDTKTDSFGVKNIGDSQSELNWKVTSWPSWGTWSISPKEGTGLKGGQSKTINVQLEVPSSPGKYDGKVKVVNQEDSSDSCEVDVSLVVTTSRQRGMMHTYLLDLLLGVQSFIYNFFNL